MELDLPDARGHPTPPPTVKAHGKEQVWPEWLGWARMVSREELRVTAESLRVRQ